VDTSVPDRVDTDRRWRCGEWVEKGRRRTGAALNWDQQLSAACLRARARARAWKCPEPEPARHATRESGQSGSASRTLPGRRTPCPSLGGTTLALASRSKSQLLDARFETGNGALSCAGPSPCTRIDTLPLPGSERPEPARLRELRPHVLSAPFPFALRCPRLPLPLP